MLTLLTLLTLLTPGGFSTHSQKSTPDCGVGATNIKNKETINSRLFEYTGDPIGGCGPAGSTKQESRPVNTLLTLPQPGQSLKNSCRIKKPYRTILYHQIPRYCAKFREQRLRATLPESGPRRPHIFRKFLT